MQVAGLPIGVSVLCPGWVRTNILEADRNWPGRARREAAPTTRPTRRSGSTSAAALAEGRTPASVADAVAEAIVADRFWVIPHQDFLDLVISRWDTIAERADPDPPEHMPGMPPRSQIIAEVMAALGGRGAELDGRLPLT